MKRSRIRRAVAALCAVVMLASLAGPAFAETEFESQLPAESATSHPAVDLLFLRPMGMLAMAGGITLFVPASVLTLMTRPSELDVPLEYLIVNPARYVWVDELGSH